ncbi:MAG: cupin domain-containing protein [Candidatus Aminicenantes bacterium]|nr:cupin domain-containing protein [Candidatus Aminicenantes bacterium]
MIVKDSSVERESLGGGVSRKILARGGKLMTVKVYFKKGGIGAVHTHPHEQISYILKGSFEFELDSKKQIVKAGDTIYMPSNIPHGVVALEEAIIVDVFSPQREDFLKKSDKKGG